MHYIVIAEIQDTSNSTSCTIQGLPEDQWIMLSQELSIANVAFVKQDDSIDIDCPGIEVINKLSGAKYRYNVVGQSMTTETTVIGSSPIPVQKIVWTLCKLK